MCWKSPEVLALGLRSVRSWPNWIVARGGRSAGGTSLSRSGGTTASFTGLSEASISMPVSGMEMSSGSGWSSTFGGGGSKMADTARRSSISGGGAGALTISECARSLKRTKVRPAPRERQSASSARCSARLLKRGMDAASAIGGKSGSIRPGRGELHMLNPRALCLRIHGGKYPEVGRTVPADDERRKPPDGGLLHNRSDLVGADLLAVKIDAIVRRDRYQERVLVAAQRAAHVRLLHFDTGVVDERAADHQEYHKHHDAVDHRDHVDVRGLKPAASNVLPDHGDASGKTLRSILFSFCMYLRTLPLAMWTTMSAGIATTKPDSVATSTSEMPRARPSMVFSIECPERLSKVVTIPLTVPSRPSRGAAAIIAPSAIRCCRNDSCTSSRSRRNWGSRLSCADPRLSSSRLDRQSESNSLKHREYRMTDKPKIAIMTGPPLCTSSTRGFPRLLRLRTPPVRCGRRASRGAGRVFVHLPGYFFPWRRCRHSHAAGAVFLRVPAMGSPGIEPVSTAHTALQP